MVTGPETVVDVPGRPGVLSEGTGAMGSVSGTGDTNYVFIKTCINR